MISTAFAVNPYLFSVDFDFKRYFLKYKLIYFVLDDDVTFDDLTEKMMSHFKIL